MKIKFISGCTAGKPNLIIISDGNKGIALDCGFQQELPNFSQITEEITHIFITHAHADHIGGVTFLKRMFPNSEIYFHELTKEIGKVTISNISELLYSKPKIKIPLKEIEEVFSTSNILYENTIVKINDNIKVVALPAGHLPGALSYLFKINSTTLLYSGDISVNNLPLAGQIILENYPIDLMISESNFTTTEETFETAMKKLIDIIVQTLKVKGKVILPIPSAGRAQEISTYFAYKIITKEIPYTTIYIDGSAKDVIKIYDIYYSRLRGYLRDIYVNARSSGIIKLVNDSFRKELIKSDVPYIILTTSANLRHGPILYYLQEILLDERSSLIFTGKVEEKGIAKTILQSKKGELIEIYGIALGRKCGVYNIEVNEHGNVLSFIDFIKRSSIKGIILTHGNEITKELISQFLMKEKLVKYTSIPKEKDNLDLSLIFDILKYHQEFDEETINFILERLIEEEKNEFDKFNVIQMEKLKEKLIKTKIIYDLNNTETSKTIFFTIFRYATKYSYKNYTIDFKFPAIMLEAISNIIKDILGNQVVDILYNQLNETAPKFFKNLVLKGGTMKAYLGIEITSKDKLEEILNNFQENFKNKNIIAPSIEKVKMLCKEEVTRNKSLEEIYYKVFGN